MSPSPYPRDRGDALAQWQQRGRAKRYEGSVSVLRAENQRLTQMVKMLQQQLAYRTLMEAGGMREDYQLELMRGRKLARLMHHGDTVYFAGIGMNGFYDVEGYAECLMRKAHEVPDPGCSCGFYIPAKLGDAYGDPRQHWVLDVEFGGKVLDCGMGALPVPARGYRASWQRVLSVTAPTLCAHCSADAENVCMGFDNRIEALCPKCASSRAAINQEKPLTWVREHLATELVAPNLTDAKPAELPAWEEEYLRYTPQSSWPVVPPGTTCIPTWAHTYYPGTSTLITTSSTLPASIWQQKHPRHEIA